MKKILSRILSYCFTAVIILFVLIAYGSINNRFYRVITIEGNSMSPTLWFGDLIVVTPPTTQDLAIDTVVLMAVDGKLVTHRIVGFDSNHRPITKGDANKIVDDFSKNELKIVGIYRFRMPGFGYPLLYLTALRGHA